MINVMDEESIKFFRDRREGLGLIGQGGTLEPFGELVQPSCLDVVRSQRVRGKQILIYECEHGAVDVELDERVDTGRVYVAEFTTEVERPRAGYHFVKYYFRTEPNSRDISQAQDLLALHDDLQFGHLPTKISCADCGGDFHWLQVPRHDNDASLATRRQYLEDEICGCRIQSGNPSPTSVDTADAIDRE